MPDLWGFVGDIFGWALLLLFLGSIFLAFRFVYTLFSSTKKWNADADKHITTGGGISSQGGSISTITIPKGTQGQAKIYIPKDKD